MRKLIIAGLAITLIPFAASCGESRSSAPAKKTGPLSLAEIHASLDAPGAHDPFVPENPPGIVTPFKKLIPADNPLTRAKVALGHQLYFDTRLS
ncbi:MAG: hypothetical protein KDB53_20310, partial [Planctomycetes bacterium]|nr:hypothetical protein [Planctomycetota bacterium]